MKTCVTVTFYDEYEWISYVEWCLENQTIRADIIALVCDSHETQVPKTTFFDKVVVLEGKRGIYKRGLAIDKAVREIDADLFISTDADCLAYPHLVETYKNIFSGVTKNWKYVANDLFEYYFNREKKDLCLEGLIVVGPNSYIHEQTVRANQYSRLFDMIRHCEMRRQYGQRGFLNGRAALHGCNFAYLKSTYMNSQPFRLGEPGKEDRDWANDNPQLVFIPAPEAACVMHIGKDSKNRGTEPMVRIQIDPAFSFE